MPQFICPHCRHVLSVRAQDIGRQGRCNKCGQRIALIGHPGDAPLMATAVETKVEPAQGAGAKADDVQAAATDRQREFLRQAGATEAQLASLSRKEASRIIESMGDAALPTEKQITHLQRLGARPEQMQAIRTRKEASALIEDMHLQPTQAQITLLVKLGAPGERIARLKSKGEASALIDEMRS